MQDTYSADQTNFSAQEPLYESATVPKKPVEPDLEAIDEKPKKFYTTTMFKVIAGLLALVAVVILIIVSMMVTSNNGAPVTQSEPTPTAQPVSNDALQQQIDALSQKLIEADPNDDALPLPPVDLTLSLEE